MHLPTPILRSALVELEPTALVVLRDGEEPLRFALVGSAYRVEDAALFGRFVRHLTISTADGQLHVVTPPRQGSIAPRAAGLPGIHQQAWIIPTADMETLLRWLGGRRGLSGHTIEDLARIATLATSRYAVEIGEKVAQMVGDFISRAMNGLGPMRGTGRLEPHRLLKPLEDAADHSQRASEAYVAALAHAAVVH